MTTQPRVRGSAFSRQLSQFDLLLVAIPLALLGGGLSPILFSVPSFVGITLGATLAASLVGYSIYVVAKSQSLPTETEPRFAGHARNIE